MATWVRALTGTAPTGTNADVTGTAELDNATAPANFDPDAVNSVRVQMTVSIISGTFASPENHTVFHDWNLTLNGNSTALASGNGANGSVSATVSSSSSDVTDSTISAGFTAAQWEGAELNFNAAGDYASGWTQFNQNMGPDGVRVDVSAVTVTIDYNPATIVHNGAGSANQAVQATATAVIGVVGAGSANQAAAASGTALELTEFQVSGFVVWAEYVLGESAGVTGAGSANQANTATASAALFVNGAATASQANSAVGSAVKAVLAAGSANQASTVSGVATLDLTGVVSANSSVTASASSVAARFASSSANNASAVSGSAVVARPAAASANNAATGSATAVKQVAGASSANSASVGSATAILVTTASGSASQASTAAGDTSVLFQAASSANSATVATANGSTTGVDAAQGSANNACVATASASVLFQGAVSANQATDVAGVSSVARIAASSANQAEAASAVPFATLLAVGSASAASAVSSVGSRQFVAASSADLACQAAAQFNLFVSLYANGDGTGADVVDENDLTSNIWQSIDDDPKSPTDTDWINNTATTASKFIALSNLPSTFGTAQVARVQARYRGQQFGSGTVTLYAQLFQSDETTSMSDEVQVEAVTGDGSFANTAELVLTGLNTSANKTVWDAALIRFRWETT